MSNWYAIDDNAAVGGASGTMSIVNSPSLSGFARKFVATYSGYGDERYNVLFGDDTTSTQFSHDPWLYPQNPSIANVEMDMNRGMLNVQTAIFGVQCDGWSCAWDYTASAGTPEKAGRKQRVGA